MARTKLTKRARDTKQQEDIKVKQLVEKKCGWGNQQIDMETSTVKMLQSNSSFHNLLKKKTSKKRRKVSLKNVCKKACSICSMQKKNVL